jgi:hypothetical protein
MVEVHRLEERLDSRLRLALLHEAAATLLIQAAEARVLRFQGRQGRKRGGDAAEEALGDGRAQERVAFSGRLREQRLRGRQRLGEAVFPEQLAQRAGIGGRRP